MAEIFAFQIAGKILGSLACEAIPEIERVWSVKSDLNRLELTVSAIKSVLDDASEKKKTNRQVEDWLEKLHDVFDDADDLLDDFITEDLRRKIVIKGSKRKEVINFFSSNNPIALRVTMSCRLKKIRKRLEYIAADRRDLQLVQRVPPGSLVDLSMEQTHSYINASDAIGRDGDMNKIVKHLLGSSCSEGSSSNQDLSVLPIVGLGGLGKTTLAKLVYNDEEIGTKFKTRLWVCVTKDFDLKRLIEKILKDAKVEHANLDLNQLQVCLRSTLESKRYLLVLDNVWNDDRRKWTNLKDLLSCGSSGSKIIVTTRKESTAKIMATSSTYKLEGLPKDKCMSIFVKCAFKEGEDQDYPKLVKIAEEIVIKCGGLPLAVKCLGSLLYTKREERDWLYIKDNELWKVKQKENDILPILKLSYDELPLQLKQCFVYCATYPKDVDHMRDYLLIAEWIALGYTQSSNSNCALEDIGNRYVRELSLRSFFQDVRVSFDGRYMSFEMHDLLHDLALSVAGKEISHVNFDTTSTVSERTRHLLLCEQNMEGKEFPDFLLKLKKVRSISFRFVVGPITKMFLDTLIKTFKCLRNLDLSDSEFEELPTSVGMLKHLRLLSISQNRKIKKLPNTISNLVNLQSLYLDGCVMLKDLPRDFGNMWSLRVLSLTSQLACFPQILDALTSLQTLSISQWYHLESLSMGMQNLTSLRNLYIADCPSLTHLSPQSLKFLTSLEKLSIGRCEKLNLLEEDAHELMDLPRGLLSLSLYEMPRLKELPRGFEKAASTIKYIWIENCPSLSILPDWLNKCKSLVKLGVENCMLLESLPLGIDQLTELRTLYIINCSEELRRKCERETGEYWPWISLITKFTTP